MNTRRLTFEIPGHMCSNCDAGYEVAIDDLKAHLDIQSLAFKMDSHPHKIVIDLASEETPDAVLADKILKEFQDIDDQACFIKSEAIKKEIYIDTEEKLAKESFQHEVIVTLNKKVAKNEKSNDLIIAKEANTEQDQQNKKKHTLLPFWLKGALGIISGGALMALMISGITLSFPITITLAIISGALTAYLGWDSFKTAFQRARKKTTSMDTLFAVSALIAVGTTIASFFVPGIHMMLDAALMIFGCRHLGFGIKNSINEKIYQTSKLTESISKTIFLKDSKAAIPVDQIKSGDVLVLQPGDVIPVDGICLSQQAYFIDRNDSGNDESFAFQANARLKAGMQLDPDSKAVTIRATSTTRDSSLAKTQENLDNAILNRLKNSKLEDSAKKILKWFVPAVLVLAIAVGITMGILFPPLLAIKAVVAVLASACPCALGLVVPTAASFGMAKAREHAVEFTGKNELQTASQIDTVVLDLNGTLTKDEQGVSFDGMKSVEPELLHAFAALEQGVKHPSGRTIYQHLLKGISGKQDVILKNIEKKSSNGIKALYKSNGKWIPIVIGNLGMMKECGIKSKIKEKPGKENYIYFACNNKIVGHITLEDQLKPEAKAIVNELRAMNKEVYICTGARYAAAKAYADELGIDERHLKAEHKSSNPNKKSEDHPAQENSNDVLYKDNFIKSLKQQGKKVAMVGDGNNDDHAMAAADFSIKIDSPQNRGLNTVPGAKISSRSLFPLVALFETADQTVSNIKQNIAASLTFNVFALGLVAVCVIAFGFVLNPAIGAALMVASASAASLWAFRFRKQALTHTSHAQKAAHKDKLHQDRSNNRISRRLSHASDLDAKPVSRSNNKARPLLSFTGHVPVVISKRNYHQAKTDKRGLAAEAGGGFKL